MAAQKELVESGNPKPKPSEITTALEHDWSNLDGAEKKRLEDTKTAELEQWKEEVTRGRGFLPCAATGELRKTCTQIRFMLRRA